MGFDKGGNASLLYWEPPGAWRGVSYAVVSEGRPPRPLMFVKTEETAHYVVEHIALSALLLLLTSK